MADNEVQVRIEIVALGLDASERVTNALEDIESSANKLNGTGAKQQGMWERLRSALSNTEEKYDAVFRAGFRLQALGGTLESGGYKIIDMLGKASESWEQYEFDQNRAASSIGIFSENLPIYKQLQDAIYKTAQTVRVFPADDIAKAVYYWGSTTGQTVKTQKDLQQVMKGLVPIMEAAGITQTDYQDVIKGTYSILKQYHLGLDHTGDVTEKLALITQKTAAEFPDLIQSFKFLGPQAHDMGISFEEAAKTLGLLADLGIRGSQSGRGLAMALKAMVNPSKAAHKALDAVFDSTFHLQKDGFDKMVFPKGKFVGLAKATDMLAKATQGMTEHQREALITTVFSQNAARVMIPLINAQIEARKKNTNAIDQEKYSLANAHQQFQKTFDLLKNSWKGLVGLLKNTFQPIVYEIGAQTAEILAPMVDQLSKVIEKVDVFVKANPKLVQTAIRWAAISAAVLVVGGTIASALGIALTFFGGVAVAISSVTGALGALTGSLVVVGRDVKVFSTWFGIIGKIASHFFLISLAVGVLVNDFGGLRTAFVNVGHALLNILLKLHINTDAWSGSMNPLVKALMPAFRSAAEKVAGALNKLADWLNELAQNKKFIGFLQWLIDNAPIAIGALLAFRTVTGTFKKVADSIKGVSDALSDIKSTAGVAKGALKGIAGMLGKGSGISGGVSDLKAGFTSLKDALKAFKSSSLFASIAGGVANLTAAILGLDTALLLNPIVDIIAGIIAIIAVLTLAWINDWGGIQEKVAAVWAFLQPILSGIITWIGNVASWIGTQIGNIINFFAQLPGNIGNFIGQVVATISALPGQIANFFGQIISKALDFAGQIPGIIINAFLFILNNIGAILGTILGNIIGFQLFVIIHVIKFGVDLISNVLGFLVKLPGMFANWFGQVWNGLVSWFGQVIAAVLKWAGEIVNNITTWIGQLPGDIARFFTQVWHNMSTWLSTAVKNAPILAGQIVTGIINWIKTLPGKIGKFFSDVWHNISSWFGQAVQQVGPLTFDVINNIVNTAKDLPGDVLKILGQLSSDMLNFFHDLPGHLWDAITGLGRQIVSGIWSGISGLAGWFLNQVHGFVSNFIGSIGHWLGISSPSKVMAAYGDYMIQGLAVGIAKNNDATKAMHAATNAVIAAGQSGSARMNAAFQFASQGNVTISGSNVRRLEVDMKVSSPDGSVNSAKLSDIQMAFNGSDFVEALEHMATKD